MEQPFSDNDDDKPTNRTTDKNTLQCAGFTPHLGPIDAQAALGSGLPQITKSCSTGHASRSAERSPGATAISTPAPQYADLLPPPPLPGA